MQISWKFSYIQVFLCILSVCGFKEPPTEKPSFIRDAVERHPSKGNFPLDEISLKPTFGEIFLPIRSAVQSTPTIRSESIKSQKTFIRDAVEYRLINNPNILEKSNKEKSYSNIKKPIATVNNPYAAFFSPLTYDFKNPQPYRAGSPFQKIIDKNDISKFHSLDRHIAEKTMKLRLTNTPKVLCYMTNWSFYRKDDGQFAPENIDTSLCTAIIYSFASLDIDTLLIKEFDPWIDIKNDLYRRTTSLGIPVLISLGGWTDSAGDKYSKLVSNSNARQNFASNLVSFLMNYGFYGIHLDWNYPKCWQSNCNKGPASDKPNFTKLIEEIKIAFSRSSRDFLLGIAISGYKEVINQAYELPALSYYADYLTVMAYDYHGAWEQKTGHVSPLFGRQDDKFPQYNTDYTMQLLVKSGASKEKLILGVPFYGQSFTLSQSSQTLVGEGVPSAGAGEPGEYTKQPGMLAYYEICQRTRKEKWLVGRDPDRKSGPYAMYRDQWVGYEDASSVEIKAKYAINEGFGGIAAWTIDLDDFQNRCCSEAFPLLKSINRALGRISTPPPFGINCERPPSPVTPLAPQMTTLSENGLSGTTWPWWSSTSQKPLTSTTMTTTTQYFTTTTTKRTTSKVPTKPSQATTTSYIESTTIPAPAIIMPVITEGEACQPGEYQRDPKNCNHYFRCVFGELHRQYCPGGLHWNNMLKSCDWPEAAKCTEYVQTPTSTSLMWTPSSTTNFIMSSTQFQTTKYTTSAPTTTRRTTPVNLTPVMQSTSKPAAQDCENGQFYQHSDCDKFFVCVHGVLVHQSCGPGLGWNTATKNCDFKENVKCSSTVKYLKLFDSRAVENGPCEGNTVLPYPGDCNKYFSCLWGKLQVFNCGSGLYWNAKEQICDWPADSGCNESTFVSGGDNNNLGTEVSSIPQTTTSSTTPFQPISSTQGPNVIPLSGHYKIVCYFTNWAWYRQGIGRYTPENINVDLCTHIVYGFAVLDYSELKIKTHDSWADIDNKFYERVSQLKNKGVKVTLALGGWNDSQGDKYSRLVRNPSARYKFVCQALEFIEKYGFQGLDLDWEYPVCWQTDCDKGYKDEKEGFAELVKDLSYAFKPRGLLLSAAVSPSKKIIDIGYDVPTLAEYFDWIAVMTYDYHGQWDKRTGHVSPLYYHPDDEYDYFNTNYTIHYWIQKGAPSRKLVMGMPLYGQAFTLANPNVNGLNAPAPGPGQAGEITRAAGFLAYYEICSRIKNDGWTVVQDEQGRMGPYAYKGNQWVSFDDKRILEKKSYFIKSLNLGGGMIWALDLDDFNNYCNEGAHPLLTTIRNILQDSSNNTSDILTQEAAIDSIETGCAEVAEPTQSVEEDKPADLGNNNILTNDYKVVCYFTNWAWYRQEGGKYLPEDIDPELCTHIVYGFAVLNRETLTIQPHDSWADLDNSFYSRVTSYRSKGIKITVAIGGWNDSAGDKYSRLVRNPSARSRFVKTVVEFIEKNNFDGLDLDWEYPVCWQVDCKKGYEDEKQGFTELVRELSEAFKPRGLLLSSAVSPNKKVIDVGYDVPALSYYFDWIAVMTYDYHGQWDKRTGHVAPMYHHPANTDSTFNSNFTIHYWIEKGADRRKLVMGMPMYGQSFSLADTNKHDLNAQTYGGGEAGYATRARGFLSYYEICKNIRERGWKVARDRRGRMGPYAYLKDQWVSFDDTFMIEHKSEYVKAMNLGGAMIWALDLDDFKNYCECEQYPLLKTINRVLRNYPGPHSNCKLEEMAEIAPDNYETTETIPSSTTSWPVYVESTTNKRTTKQPDSIQSTGSLTGQTCGNRNFASHERDCNRYYQCQFDAFIEKKCPNGLYWNNGHCDWPANTQCISSRSFPKPTKKTISRSLPEEVVIPRSFKKSDLPAAEISSYFNDNNKYKVVCYFSDGAAYRPDEERYTINNIDEKLCTHIVYSFAILNNQTLTIEERYPEHDREFLKQITKLRHNGVQLILGIEGWDDSTYKKYKRIIQDGKSRAEFIGHAINFIQKHNFDGLDLYWEMSSCLYKGCFNLTAEDKNKFAAFVRELSEAFVPKGLLLSSAVSASKYIIDSAYDVPTLSRYLDWITITAYDYHGHWNGKVGHIAPLYFTSNEEYDTLNVNFSTNYWIQKGASAKKLVIGIPFYGQTFTISDSNKNEINALTKEPRKAGTLAYYEICKKVNAGGWNISKDKERNTGHYASNLSEWISYDDVEDVRRKAELVKNLNLGGAMIWSLDLDDFKGQCGCGKYPLLRTLTEELQDIKGPKLSNCT